MLATVPGRNASPTKSEKWTERGATGAGYRSLAVMGIIEETADARKVGGVGAAAAEVSSTTAANPNLALFLRGVEPTWKIAMATGFVC